MSIYSRTEIVHSVCMSENTPIQFKLMLPADLKIRVEEMASLNRRSLSQEIVAALEDKYPTPNATDATGIEARVLLWLAARIRKGAPKPGSMRDRQAAAYEVLAGRSIAQSNDEGYGR
ncbi:MAG: hypothetical protein ABJ360_17375 [Roseobacter sp.]